MVRRLVAVIDVEWLLLRDGASLPVCRREAQAYAQVKATVYPRKEEVVETISWDELEKAVKLEGSDKMRWPLEVGVSFVIPPREPQLLDEANTIKFDEFIPSVHGIGRTAKLNFAYLAVDAPVMFTHFRTAKQSSDLQDFTYNQRETHRLPFECYQRGSHHPVTAFRVIFEWLLAHHVYTVWLKEHTS